MTRLALILMSLLLQNPARQAQTGTVTGLLLRTDGTPAVGVRIGVTPVPDPKNPGATGSDFLSLAQTDANGNYRLEDILPGRYFIQAGLLDLPNYYPGTSSLDKATAITVTAGEVLHVDEFRMVRPPGIRISGRLTPDPFGRQQMVTIGASNPLTPQMTVQMLSAVSSSGTGSFTFSNGVTATLNNGNVVRVLIPMGAISGLPLPGNSGTPGPTTVNSDGTFEFFGVKPGTYSVTVPAPMTPPLQATIVVEDKDIEIHFPTDESAVKVSGIVGLTETSRSREQKIMLTGPVWGRIDATTNADGAFEFPSVPRGSYVVRLMDGSPLSTIVVADRELTGVMIPTLVVLSGYLSVEDGNAPNAVPPLLLATRTDGTQVPLSIPRGSMTVFADGGTGTAFKLALSEGEYRITCTNLIPPFVVKSITSGDVDLMKNPLIVNTSAPLEIRVTIGKSP